MKIKSKIIYWSLKILIIFFGLFLIVFGELDDSPGAQGLGLILVVSVVVFVVRDKKNKLINFIY